MGRRGAGQVTCECYGLSATARGEAGQVTCECSEPVTGWGCGCGCAGAWVIGCPRMRARLWFATKHDVITDEGRIVCVRIRANCWHFYALAVQQISPSIRTSTFQCATQRTRILHPRDIL
jgi:hypothetical protein